VYRQACMLSAARATKAGKYQDAGALLEKARQWPERLGVGKPYDVDNRFEDYLEGLSANKIGDNVRGRKFFEQIAAYTQSHAGDMGVSRLFGALAEKALGHEQAALKLLEPWSRDGKSPMARWLVSVFKGDNAAIASSEKDLYGVSNVSLMGRASIDQELALLLEVFHTVQF